MRVRKRQIWVYATVFLAYLLLTLAMTWPVIARSNTHLVGDGDDMWVQYWNGWWVKKALMEGGDVYSTRLLFFPQTVSLVYHNFGWINIAGWLLMQLLVKGVTASNLVYLTNITLCAFAMFVLAYRLFKSVGPAFIAGTVYGFWPYRLSDYNHPNLISTQWLPLVLLSVILLVRQRGRVRHALLVGLFLALTGLSRWQMLLPTMIAVGVYLFFSLLFERECWSWRVMRILALAGLVAALLVAIPFYPLVRDLVTSESSSHLQLNQEAEKQTDLLAYFVPPMNHPLAPLFDGLGYVHSLVRLRYSAFLGYAVLAMVGAAVIWRWRTARPWIALAFISLLLSLGPVLRFDGTFYPSVPMPYRLVNWLAPMRWMRYPHRFNVLLALPVAVLAGCGVAALQDRLAGRRPALLWGILTAMVLFDYFNLPAATVLANVPEFYVALSQDESDFAVLDLPMGRARGDYYMYYQTVHGHPIVEGNTARPQPYMFDFINDTPLLRALRDDAVADLSLGDTSYQLRLLDEAGVRYIVVHKPFVQPGQLEGWQALFPLALAYEDDQVLVYHTALEYGRDFDFTVELGDGIGLISGTLSTVVVTQSELLEVDLKWGTRAAPTRNWVVHLSLVSVGEEAAQALEVEPYEGWPTSEWGVNTVARRQIAMQVDPFLEGGVYEVMLALMDPSSGDVAGGAVSLSQIEVHEMERFFEPLEMAQPVNATFGDVLSLLGYVLTEEEDVIKITFQWQAQQRMDVAYKMFVHLYAPTTGELVAQADVMPRNWSYPTNWWEAGEVVSDQLAIPLKDVSPGMYRLAVGAYDPETGIRLPVRDSSGRLQPMDRLVLGKDIQR